MKVGIVFVNSINVCPYIDKYINILHEEKIDFDIIAWERSGSNVQYKHNVKYLLNLESNLFGSKIKKLFHFRKFSKYTKNIIKKEKYDKLIILSTLSGMMMPFYILKNYKDKYIFDYRDVSKEKYKFYKFLMFKLIKNSEFTCVSSRGFEKILPKQNYVMAHNFQYNNINKNNNFTKNTSLPIRITQMGFLRGFEISKILCDIFKDDLRFEFNIYGIGNGFEELEKYTKSIENINVIGPYDNNKKKQIMDSSDMFMYIYPNNLTNEISIANKFYDALFWSKPIIANKDTYSGKIVEENFLGVAIKYYENPKELANQIYDYYININENIYDSNKRNVIKNILDEDLDYLNKIKKFVVQ